MEFNNYNQFKIYFLLMLLMFSKSALSNTFDEGLEAEQNHQHQEAVERWTQLANKSDIVA